MSVQRRTFLTGGVLAVGGDLHAPHPAPAARTTRAPLRPPAFHRRPPGAARPRGWLATHVRNQHSGKVLAVDRMSTADSAWVVRFADPGTRDRLWRIL